MDTLAALSRKLDVPWMIFWAAVGRRGSVPSEWGLAWGFSEELLQSRHGARSSWQLQVSATTVFLGTLSGCTGRS
jgi:hypothetical protein